MVSIRDVAAEAKAPISAVSLILNAKPHTYSSATEERVRVAAEKLGYLPRAYAKSMRLGRNQLIVMLMSRHASTLQTMLRTGIIDELEPRGLRFGIGYVDHESFVDAANPGTNFLTQWSADGMILNYNTPAPEGLVELLQRYRLPYVQVNSKEKTNSLHPMDYEAGQEITQKLIQLGHKKIAYVTNHTGPLPPHFSVTEREGGYRDALQAAGLKPHVLTTVNDDLDTTRRQVWNAWPAKERPTAYICYSLHNVLHLLYLSAQDGYVVPRDFSIATFGDITIKEGGIPISYMNIPFEGMGQRAVQIIEDMLESKKRLHPTEALPLTLANTSTLAPPPSK